MDSGPPGLPAAAVDTEGVDEGVPPMTPHQQWCQELHGCEPGLDLAQLRLALASFLHPRLAADALERVADLPEDLIAAVAAKLNFTNPKYPNLPKRVRAGYHALNMDYPGLQQIHSNPDIFIVNNFLAPDECDGIVGKAHDLRPSNVANSDGVSKAAGASRTCTSANVMRREVPSVVAKLKRLYNVDDERRMEVLNVVRYGDGQENKKHCDSVQGGWTCCGFEHSGRVVSTFMYLNSVRRGGATVFEAGIQVQPEKGMALIHFPLNLELGNVAVTAHAGAPAIDEKYILISWLWKHPQIRDEFGENNSSTRLTSTTI